MWVRYCTDGPGGPVADDEAGPVVQALHATVEPTGFGQGLHQTRWAPPWSSTITMGTCAHDCASNSGLPDDARRAIYHVAYLFQGIGMLWLLDIVGDQVMATIDVRMVQVWDAIAPYVEREREINSTTGAYLLLTLEELAAGVRRLPPDAINTMIKRHRRPRRGRILGIDADGSGSLRHSLVGRAARPAANPEVLRKARQGALSRHLPYGASPLFPAATKESTSICHSSRWRSSSAVRRTSLSQLFDSQDCLTVTRPS